MGGEIRCPKCKTWQADLGQGVQALVHTFAKLPGLDRRARALCVLQRCKRCGIYLEVQFTLTVPRPDAAA